MDLKIGDLVAFKNYEDMTEGERCGISEKKFPEFGKVSKIYDSIGFRIKGSPYIFTEWSIDHVISSSNTDDIHAGDEVLVKVLKHKEEHFIVQENHYGMYVNGSEVLVVNKDDAKIYNSRDAANEAAAGLHLNAWNVIPYGD